MFTYLVRRILLMVPTMLGITLVVFGIMKAAPGDPAQMLISPDGELRPDERAELIEYTRRRYGLDLPVHEQYLRWLNMVSPIGFGVDEDGALSGFGFKVPDLGESFVKRRPVLDLIAESLPITLLLNVLTIPIIYTVAIATGLLAARFRGQWFDNVSGLFFLGLWSFPTMLAGVLMINLFANEQYINAFPYGGMGEAVGRDMAFLPGRGDDGAWSAGYLLFTMYHLVLPVICLSYGGFAFLSKLTRSATLENLSKDFVRTARAKGVREKNVLFAHVLRNSLLPLITVLAGLLPSLLAGAVIVETIFSINGMGRLAIQAIEFKDQEVVMAITLISGLLGLVGYLIADVGYAIADPRVSYE